MQLIKLLTQQKFRFKWQKFIDKERFIYFIIYTVYRIVLYLYFIIYHRLNIKNLIQQCLSKVMYQQLLQSHQDLRQCSGTYLVLLTNYTSSFKVVIFYVQKYTKWQIINNTFYSQKNSISRLIIQLKKSSWEIKDAYLYIKI